MNGVSELQRMKEVSLLGLKMMMTTTKKKPFKFQELLRFSFSAVNCVRVDYHVPSKNRFLPFLFYFNNSISESDESRKHVSFHVVLSGLEVGNYITQVR